VQGGYVTLPWWRGGASGAAVTQGGYRTLPWWQAGGTGTAPAAGAGFITWPWWMAGGDRALAREEERQAGGKRRRWDRERELANARAALLAAVGRPLGQDEEDELLAVVYWWLQ
jgi:hypothetical protein